MYPGEIDDLKCPDCGARMRLRPSKHGLFYSCSRFPYCRGTHGAHPDGAPLGAPSDRETKQARIRAHEYFDRLWKEAERMYGGVDRKMVGRVRRIARTRAYEWLATQFLVEEVHIGSMTIEECERVVYFCDGVSPHYVREWAKRREDKRETKS